MIKKMMDLCSRANQYDDASLDSAAPDFRFGCAEFAIAEGRSRSVRRAALLRRSCDAHLNSVRQSVGARGHHFLSRLQSAENLHIVAGVNSGFYSSLMCVVVRPNDHHIR